MALATATITFDVADLLGVDFDARRIKAWTTTNADNNRLIDTAANKVRMGDGVATVAADGTGSFSVWVPGADGNPTSWQQTFWFDYPLPGGRGRETRSFGPFTITGSADLADLEQEQAIPPTYLSEVTAALSGLVDDAQDAADAAESSASDAAASAATAHDISNIDTSDDVVSTLVADPESDTAVALATSIAEQGGGVKRLNLVCDGDSNFAGGNGLVPPEYQIHRQIADGMANTTTRNFGVSGQQITDMIVDAATQIDTLIDTTPGVLNLLLVGGGGNDLNDAAHPSAATVYARKQAYHAARRAAGWTTIECTILPRSVAMSWGAGYETNRAALNTLIRNDHSYADGFVDSDVEPSIATVAATADTRIWPDSLHLSTLGLSRLVNLIKPQVAALGALTGQRQPLATIPGASFFVPASAFNLAKDGTPPVPCGDPASGWEYADAARSNVIASIQLPKSWKRIHLCPWWTPLGCDGNVSHAISLTPVVAGGTWYLGTSSVAVYGVGAGQNVIVSSEPNSDATPNSDALAAAVSWSLSYVRNVGDTTHDTHTGAEVFLGIEVINRTSIAD